MSKFLVFKILVFSLVCQAGYAFLLDGSTVRPNDGSQYLTMRHYVQLMDSLYDEKQARHQLEQIVATLQTKMDAMNNNGGQTAVNLTTYIQPYISRVENQERELKAVRTKYDSLLQTKEAEIAKLSTTVTVLEQNYTRLLHDSTVTQTDYHRLKLEVDSLKQIKNLDVANGLQETKNDINMLKASNQARSQDFLALYNLTISAKKDISITTKELDNINNGSVTKIQDLNDKISRLEMSHNLTSLQVNTNVKKDSVIDTEIRGLNDKMTRLENSQNLISMQVNTTVRSLSTRAGFTVCSAYYVPGNRMKFIQVVAAYGLSDPPPYADGNFRVEKAGFYLVIVNILSKDMNAFYIKVNGRYLSRTYSHYLDSHGDDEKFTASTSVLIKAAVRDVISIEGSGGDLEQGSCLTVLKL
ncbi:uncharacterized protein LOC143058403 [Mytilus galloprovincialis]|uniref:uncharacterized protein LOC143058403 n=1 Tax=Mytilus galloprovincialis TaxID=29158 RepID=UPI003F7C76B5